MNVTYNEEFNILTVKNIFDKDINKKMLDEAIQLKDFYKPATISDDAKIVEDYRTNDVAFLDDIFIGKRNNSDILKNIDNTLSGSEVSGILNSTTEPLGLLASTNYNETQVSRYGNNGQEYKFHKDKFNNKKRMLTMVYYMSREPKKYTGGDIIFTKSPILKDGSLLDENISSIKMTPENNMAVFFSSSLVHGVMPTKSPTEFGDGRFSINCWIGRR